MEQARKGILTGLTMLGITGWLFYFPPMSVATSIPAPEIISSTWLNSEPLHMEKLARQGGDGGVLDIWMLELPEYRTLCQRMARQVRQARAGRDCGAFAGIQI